MTSPAYMDYTALVKNIREYSERPNDEKLLAQIPQIVLLAETELAADLKILGTELVADTELSPGEAVVAKPSYWRTTTSMTIEVPGRGSVTLFKRTLEFVKTFWPSRATRGVPRFYAEYNAANFLVAPTPDANYPMQLVYSARIQPLSTETATNWFTTNAPQLLLFSCMRHTSLYLKNLPQATYWKAQYDAALGSMKVEDASLIIDRSTIEG